MKGYCSYAGPCWRAVAAGREWAILGGSERVGRYNRPEQRTLYVSGSLAGVTAAMARYGDAARSVVRLEVQAERLVDLRDPGACATLGIEPSRANEDWVAAIERREEPASWLVADWARAIGAVGLIDGSRRSPSEWHLVLFRWNRPGGASVRIATGSSRE